MTNDAERERIRKAMEERRRLQEELQRKEVEKKRLEQQLRDRG